MNKVNDALNYFRNNNNCSQSVLVSFREKCDVDERTCLKIASGFGGGMGKNQKTCGAITGAYMALGLFFAEQGNEVNKQIVYEKINEFNKVFLDKYNSLDCLELLGENMKTEEGRKNIEQGNFFSVKCEKYIEEAVIILENMLNS